MSTAVLPSHSTTGTLGMFNGTKDGKPAFVDFGKGTANINPPVDVPIIVEDIRFMSPQPTYLKNGYEFHSHVTCCTPEQLAEGKSSPQAKKLVDEHYMPEVIEIIKKATGGAEVVPNGFRLRTQLQDGNDILKSKVGYGSINVCHVDRDNSNAIYRLNTSVGVEIAQSLLKKYKKWASVNVWRPIGETVHKWPLAFVNTQSVPGWDYDTHMARVQNIDDPAVLDRGEKSHETVLFPHPDYRYYYASKVTKDEVLIFASFHTDPTKVIPHGAFWDNNTEEGAPPRRSIEARCWVFWDEIEKEE